MSAEHDAWTPERVERVQFGIKIHDLQEQLRAERDMSTSLTLRLGALSARVKRLEEALIFIENVFEEWRDRSIKDRKSHVSMLKIRDALTAVLPPNDDGGTNEK